MKTTNYSIRLDPMVKEQAEEVFTSLGLKLSDAINVFLHKSIDVYGFPFEVRNRRPKVELLESIEEADRIIDDIKNGTRLPYTSTREMFDAMDTEDAAEGEDV
jgi:DNA-damage-inducible protein J